MRGVRIRRPLLIRPAGRVGGLRGRHLILHLPTQNIGFVFTLTLLTLHFSWTVGFQFHRGRKKQSECITSTQHEPLLTPLSRNRKCKVAGFQEVDWPTPGRKYPHDWQPIKDFQKMTVGLVRLKALFTDQKAYRCLFWGLWNAGWLVARGRLHFCDVQPMLLLPTQRLTVRRTR